MAEQEDPKRRGHRWRPGQSGNPRGRPRSGNALAEAVRAGVEPAELVAIAVDLARHAESDATRLQAIGWLRDSGYNKPAERHEVLTATVDAEVAEWARRLENASDADLDALTRLASAGSPRALPPAPRPPPAPRLAAPVEAQTGAGPVDDPAD